MQDLKYEIATLAGGCFWCTEAVFQRLKGVISVKPGYAGGNVPNPSYEEVVGGATGHAESIQIEFDPGQISYKELLDVHFRTHDPTTVNRQGNDVGPQYRSVIFYHDEAQKKAAEKAVKLAQQYHTDPIVTEIVPYSGFYEAEDYHQNYYNLHRNQPYCMFIIDPKIAKLEANFAEKLKA